MNIFSKIPKAQEADKPLLFTLIKYCCSLSEKMEREGILSLEEGVHDEHITVKGESQPFAAVPMLERFIKHFTLLVIDGHDGELIADCARYALASFSETDGETLLCMIFAEGILAVQRGDNPEAIRHRLASMLGLELYDQFITETDENPFLLAFLDIPPLPDEAEWQKTYAAKWERLTAERAATADDADAASRIQFLDIARMDDVGIQKLLRELDQLELVSALIPPDTKPVREAFFRNMSENAAKMLQYDMATRHPRKVEWIFESQQKILSTLRRLMHAGIIILPR